MFTPSHWLEGLVRVLTPHPIHACARGCFLSVFFLLSLYFFLKSFFHLFLIPAMVPDENSMEDPLCNSSFGSMVSLDYVTPDTLRRCQGPLRTSGCPSRRTPGKRVPVNRNSGRRKWQYADAGPPCQRRTRWLAGRASITA